MSVSQNDPGGAPSASAKYAYALTDLAAPPIVSTNFCMAFAGHISVYASFRKVFRIAAASGVALPQIEMIVDNAGRPYVQCYDTVATSTRLAYDSAPAMGGVASLDPYVLVATYENGGNLVMAWITENAAGTQVTGTATIASLVLDSPSATNEWGFGMIANQTGSAWDGYCDALVFHTYASAGDMPTPATLAAAVMDNRQPQRLFTGSDLGTSPTLVRALCYGTQNYAGGAQVGEGDTLAGSNCSVYDGSNWRNADTMQLSGTHKLVSMYRANHPAFWKRRNPLSVPTGEATRSASMPVTARAVSGALTHPFVKAWLGQSLSTREWSQNHSLLGMGQSNWRDSDLAAHLSDAAGVEAFPCIDFTSGSLRSLSGFNVGFPHTSGSTTQVNMTVQQSDHWACRFFPNGEVLKDNVGTRIAPNEVRVVGGDIALLGATDTTASTVALAAKHFGKITSSTPANLVAYTIRCPGASDLDVEAVSRSDTVGTAETVLVASQSIDCQPSWESPVREVGVSITLGQYDAQNKPAGNPDGFFTTASANASDIPADALAAMAAGENNPYAPRVACWNKDSGEVNIVTSATFNAGSWELGFARLWIVPPVAGDQIMFGEFDLVRIEIETSGTTGGHEFRALKITRNGSAIAGDEIKMPVGMFGMRASSGSGRVVAGLGVGSAGYGDQIPHTPPWILGRVLESMGVDLCLWTDASNYGYADQTTYRDAIRDHNNVVEHVIIGEMMRGSSSAFTDSATIQAYHTDARAGAITENLAIIDLLDAVDGNGDALIGDLVSQIMDLGRDDGSHPSPPSFVPSVLHIETQLVLLAVGGDRTRNRTRDPEYRHFGMVR